MEEYLQTLTGNMWGGPMEMDAAAELYGVNIFEYSTQNQYECLSHQDVVSRGLARLITRYSPPGWSAEERKRLNDWHILHHKNHYQYACGASSCGAGSCGASSCGASSCGASSCSPSCDAPSCGASSFNPRDLRLLRKPKKPVPKPSAKELNDLRRQREEDAEMARQLQKEELNAFPECGDPALARKLQEEERKRRIQELADRTLAERLSQLHF